MNPHSLDVLEYHRLLTLIAAYAGSASGRDYILGLTPYTTPDIAQSEFVDLTRTALQLRRDGVHLPVAQFESPQDLLRRAGPTDAVLDAEAFLLLRVLLRTAREIRYLLVDRLPVPCPALESFGATFPDLSDIADAIDRVFDADGAVRDSAGPRLAEIRRDLNKLERRVRRKLDQLLQNQDLADVVQESHASLRNHRYVIPIRREQKAVFPGVVHDQSNSGRTLFIEPAGTVEIGNELASLRLEERDEIRRILLALTDTVRRARDDLRFLAERLTLYDAIHSVSHWAVEFDCRYVEWDKRLSLKNARHPLLQHQFRQEDREDELIPLNLQLPPASTVLVVTGSNAGGKTVVLKTVGLLTLMAQAGLPAPVGDNSRLRRFENVLADIGDEQSLQQNLSTFSSHLTHIRNILNEAGGQDSLILLDELGAGTDPTEGGALGCAILDRLSRSAGITLATTHLATIKHFVHEHERMSNASVLFNDETLRPEYVLSVGRPGASHAMTIARNIGLPTGVLDHATSFLNSEQLHLETLLAQMDQDQRRLQSDVEEAQAARNRIVREREELAQELKGLRRERKRRLNEAQREAAAIVDNARREMNRLLSDAADEKDETREKELRRRIEKKKRELNEAIAETQPRPERKLDPEQLATGQRVWVEVLRDHGVITWLSADRKRAKVDVDGMNFDVKTAELGVAQSKPEPKEDPRQAAVGRPRRSTAARTELKLLGKRVEAALREVEEFLDDAALAGLGQVRIVHGFGTGALREAIHGYLKECPVVTGFHIGVEGKEAGGAGVTWVDL